MKQSLFPQNPVLLVDDESASLRGFKMILKSAGINNLLLCRDSREVMPILATHKIEVILLDLIMPFLSGEEVLTMIAADYPEIPVIVITGNTKVDMAVRCMKTGTFDYMVKPIEKNRLVSGLKCAIEIRGLQNENQLLKARILSGKIENPGVFSHIITKDRSMFGLFQYAESIAKSPQPVLITGETGVGKELMARAIHRLSCREGALITVNAAGIDDNVFSDTLFGHVNGAFTGAERMRRGMVENAFGGTLFLDEIGDLRPESQIKLLRLLQEREYFPLGADVPKIADAKIIVATNRDLSILKDSGRLRKDLYYRITSHHLHIPPLRERLNDLPLLVNHFLDRAARDFGKKAPSPPAELFTLLSNYHFPGNVRELKSMIYDAVARHKSKIMSMELFEAHISKESSIGVNGAITLNLTQDSCGSHGEVLPTLEQATFLLVQKAMQRSGNNKSMAARFLGISRQRLGRYLKKKL